MSFSNVRATFAAYKELSKSGIVTLVLISVLGGYLIGETGQAPLDGSRLALTLLGVLFLASGSSALNQVQERHIDGSMPRTARRPLPSGRLSAAHALTFSVVTVGLGIAILASIGTDLLLMGLAAVLLYNGLYTLWWKRRWAFAAIPGAIPGAIPALIGYASASHRAFAPGGVYLFFVLFFWQMPHFWVLALRFKDDYEKGGFPTLPVAHGAKVTVAQITLWCLAYVGLALIGPLFLNVSLFYLACAIAISVKLLWELRRFARSPESKQWLGFFLWVNFSLIILIGAAAVDVWRYQLFRSWWLR